MTISADSETLPRLRRWLWPDDFGRFVARWIAVSFAWHLASAWLSSGFFHADEHFQILEFVSYKRGDLPAAALPWEFAARIRPTLQVAVGHGVMRLVESVAGPQSPFFHATILRCLASLVGWLSCASLMRISRDWLPSERAARAAVIGLAVFYPIPFLDARYSSESLAGSLFFLGLVAARRGREGSGSAARLVAAGGLIAAAFACRFQIAFMAAGFIAWLWLYERRVKDLAALAIGAAAILACALASDRWFYGDWVLTPVNYVVENLVNGHAAAFGTLPWWGYLELTALYVYPPFGILVIAGVALACVGHRRHLLTWTLVPFLVAHAAVAHKELRFLFPVAKVLPIYLALAAGTWWRLAQNRPTLTAWTRRAARWLAPLALAANSILLVALTVLPATMRMPTLEALYREYRAAPFVLYAIDGKSPFRLGDGELGFYRPPTMEIRDAKAADLRAVVKASGRRAVIALQGFGSPTELGFSPSECRVLGRAVPDWFRHLDWGGRLSRLNLWRLVECS
jgi:phosphatidylinositol glycan class B